MQIHNILMDRHAYSHEKAEKYVEDHRDDKVYELLVLKKQLMEQEEQQIDVSISRSIWRHNYED
jgi:hypothetical protein